MNDKIFVFRNMFYSRAPAYQQAFQEKKRRMLEEKMNLEKMEYEKKMNDLLKKQKRKIKTDKKLEDWRNNDGMEGGPSNGITTTQMILMFRAKHRKQEKMLRR